MFRRKTSSASVFFLLLLTCGCGLSPPENEVTRAPFHDGLLVARYLEILGPAPYASHTVRFYFVGSSGEQLLAQTELRNDGKNPNTNNVEVVEKQNGKIEIILKGEEQADARWIAETTDGKVTMTKLDVR